MFNCCNNSNCVFLEMNTARVIVRGLKYPVYPLAREGQASATTVFQRVKEGLKNYKSRSPGLFPSIRGPLVHMARMSQLKGATLELRLIFFTNFKFEFLFLNLFTNRRKRLLYKIWLQLWLTKSSQLNRFQRD